MRKELIVKSKMLTGTSDLTLLAPVKPGFVPSLDAVTYGTRAKRLMETLTGGRASSHEYSLIRPFADSVERVAMIHSFRVAVLEPENKILLAVTFDGTWEAYIRTLWEKVGTLLDVIFCNSENYVTAFDHTFEEWTEWVRRVQVETHFFFSTSRSTVDDANYTQGFERIGRAPVDPVVPMDLAFARHRKEVPEVVAWNAAGKNPVETFRQGMQSLAVLFRLTDMYLPTPGYADPRDEGRYLTRAARDLLLELRALYESPKTPDSQKAMFLWPRFRRQLDWLCPAVLPPALQARSVPQLPAKKEDLPDWPKADVQGGIVQGYDGATHGCLVLLAFDSAKSAGDFIDRIKPLITTAEVVFQNEQIAMNVAVTYEGFRRLGLSEEQLAYFPLEFRQGMEARASILGDFRSNHPRRWRIPVRNWPAGRDASRQAVELSAVHMIVQMRVRSARQETDICKETHPLFDRIRSLVQAPGGAAYGGVDILSVQAMQRYAVQGDKLKDHFGFEDLKSQPFIEPAIGQDGKPSYDHYANQVQLGEMLLGYPNEADQAPKYAFSDEQQLFRNGSYFVIRKLQQNVANLNATVAQAAATTRLSADLILAKMMGRQKDGKALIATGKGGENDFNYDQDPKGALCPIHSHIRRANPRESEAGPSAVIAPGYAFKGGRRPHLIRRGMPYGPAYDPSDPALPVNQEARGLIFMAYNASLAEQFEVVQRWIAGGNSSGGFSRHSDPFLGVPDNEQIRHFRFEEDGKPYSMQLDGAPTWDADRKPLVQLDWGMYAFVPSMTSLQFLKDTALAAGKCVRPPWSVAEGYAKVLALQHVEAVEGREIALKAWKSILEDSVSLEKYVNASVWAAIRKGFDGALSTPYGILVADKRLVMQVLRDPEHRYSVRGYHQRMQNSIGEIYLGLDRPGNGDYDRYSQAVNAAIGSLTEVEAFELAYQYTRESLYKDVKLPNSELRDPYASGFIAFEQFSASVTKTHWELNLDAKEVSDRVLAALCQQWFGLPRVGDHERLTDPGKVRQAGIVYGSWRWDWQDTESPIYPSQFTAPSRYIFQANPSEDVKAFGERYGAALTKGVEAFLAPFRRAYAIPQNRDGGDAVLAKAILNAFPAPALDNEVARIFVGVLMGMLPTIDGNFRLSLNEWLRDGTFWSLRAKWQADTSKDDLDKARRILGPALYESMQLRPSPEMIWRTASVDHTLGGIQVKAGDVLVASLVSAMHQCLEENHVNLEPVFGGNRRETGAPTHACPGYTAAMGVLFGLFAGLMSVSEKMRASPVPLAFTISAQ